jgi:hypothetical protein
MVRERSEPLSDEVGGAAKRQAEVCVSPGFVLFFAVDAGRPIEAIPPLPRDFGPPSQLAEGWLSQIDALQKRFLGHAYVKAGRILRIPVGRISMVEPSQHMPHYADIVLLAHVSGIALLEAWLPAPIQPFEAPRWIDWLDAESEGALPVRVWQKLLPIAQELTGRPLYDAFFPISVVRAPDALFASLREDRAIDIVRLLFLDRSDHRFKSDVVAHEVERDYCLRDDGITLLGRRSGFDLHRSDAAYSAELPKEALPFLIAVEQLLVERSVLVRLYHRLSSNMPTSIEELLATKEQALDTLEEYSGAITAMNRFSDAVATDGEELFGITDLYDAVMDRLDSVSFSITTRYQSRTTLLQVWLTVAFGAIGIGSIASIIAIWLYPANLGAVLGWTLGTTVAAALILVGLLRRQLR